MATPSYKKGRNYRLGVGVIVTLKSSHTSGTKEKGRIDNRWASQLPQPHGLSSKETSIYEKVMLMLREMCN